MLGKRALRRPPANAEYRDRESRFAVASHSRDGVAAVVGEQQLLGIAKESEENFSFGKDRSPTRRKARVSRLAIASYQRFLRTSDPDIKCKKKTLFKTKKASKLVAPTNC